MARTATACERKVLAVWRPAKVSDRHTGLFTIDHLGRCKFIQLDLAQACLQLSFGVRYSLRASVIKLVVGREYSQINACVGVELELH